MSAVKIVGGGVMGMAMLAASVLGLVIHVWTIMLAFSIKGLFAAVLTLIFPVLSELYWFFKVGSNVGYDATYCVSIMAYVGLFVLVFVGAMIVTAGD
jgi:hypothetical protein